MTIARVILPKKKDKFSNGTIGFVEVFFNKSVKWAMWDERDIFNRRIWRSGYAINNIVDDSVNKGETIFPLLFARWFYEMLHVDDFFGLTINSTLTL